MLDTTRRMEKCGLDWWPGGGDKRHSALGKTKGNFGVREGGRGQWEGKGGSLVALGLEAWDCLVGKWMEVVVELLKEKTRESTERKEGAIAVTVGQQQQQHVVAVVGHF